ncbi:MAG: hypothetical protein WAR57_10830 [Candidatus Phosphoribacter sp.]|nr:hypothetical protein [Actinomycetales bacterium]
MSLSIDPVPLPSVGGAALPGTMAPEAPGRLGQPLDVTEAFGYLRDLGVWRDKRKAELDSLDSVALASSERDLFSRDMLVSMALWKAISDRYDLLVVTFDSGRVGPAEAARLSTLVWGRLDVAPDSAASSISPATAGALGLSLPEAARLCDAMTSSLRARLSLEPSGAEVGTRLKDVRATVERIRDQVSLLPSGVDRDTSRATLTRLEQRLVDITDRAKRGAEVGGLIAPLEFDAAATERDLLVGAGRRVDDARDVARAAQLREELVARSEAVQALVARCVGAVTPAPKMAVPDVRALGPVPTGGRDVESYLRRLDSVSRALTLVHTAYGDALAARDEIEGYTGALTAQARATGLADPDADHLRQRLESVLAVRPTDVRRARALLAAYQAYAAAWAPSVAARTAPKGAQTR